MEGLPRLFQPLSPRVPLFRLNHHCRHPESFSSSLNSALLGQSTRPTIPFVLPPPFHYDQPLSLLFSFDFIYPASRQRYVLTFKYQSIRVGGLAAYRTPFNAVPEVSYPPQPSLPGDPRKGVGFMQRRWLPRRHRVSRSTVSYHHISTPMAARPIFRPCPSFGR